MNLCPKCGRSPWPFVMVLAMATFAASITWITLGLSVDQTAPRAIASGIVFLAVGGTLLHYVLGCLRRHCRHGKENPLEARLRRAAHGHNH